MYRFQPELSMHASILSKSILAKVNAGRSDPVMIQNNFDPDGGHNIRGIITYVEMGAVISNFGRNTCLTMSIWQRNDGITQNPSFYVLGKSNGSFHHSSEACLQGVVVTNNDVSQIIPNLERLGEI